MKFPLLSCSDCKYHERVYGEDDNYSYCHKKKQRLYFFDRNWVNRDFEFICFAPNEKTKKTMDEYYKKLDEKRADLDENEKMENTM